MLASATTLIVLFSLIACEDNADSSKLGRDAGAHRDAGAKHAHDAASPSDAAEERNDAAASSHASDAMTPSATFPPLADGIVGSGCTADSDCGAGRCMGSERITKSMFPGGYCTGSCTSDNACGAHGVCAAGFRGTPGTCYLRCENDADCPRDGYRCRQSSAGIATCLPGPQPLPDNVVGNP